MHYKPRLKSYGKEILVTGCYQIYINTALLIKTENM